MTLKRRLTLQITLMLAGIALLGCAGVIGVVTLHTDLGISLRANEQLRHVYTIGVRVATARSLAERSPEARGAIAAELQRAADLFDAYGQTPNDRWIDGTDAAADAVSRTLRQAVDQLNREAASGDSQPLDASTIFAAPYSRFADLIAATRQAVAHRQVSADQKQRWTLSAVAGLAVFVMAGAIFIAMRQYRSVIRPLGDVRSSARRIASGHFSDRARVNGDEEFVALATDFNRMAADLQALYADLEQRIAIKSRELAQSERLASVGFLAAGVAHEINNPLGIIAGHGERSLRRLERGGEPNPAQLHESLRIICDEAFRCKRITDGLLALARPGDEARAPVRLDHLVRDVVGTLTALPRFSDREAILQADASTDWTIIANEARLRQVVLNLAVNALEATSAPAGRVSITLQRVGESIELVMTDNGKGMTAESIGRIFEPFYTEKRGGHSKSQEYVGTGLGLSIVHSIIANLGGTIHAYSEGIGRGSTFVISLPSNAIAADVKEFSMGRD